MDTPIYLGLGVSVVFFFLRYAVNAVPKFIAWAGVVAGLLIVLAQFLPLEARPPMSVVILFLIGFMALATGGYLWIQNMQGPKRTTAPLSEEAPTATGAAPADKTSRGSTGVLIKGKISDGSSIVLPSIVGFDKALDIQGDVENSTIKGSGTFEGPRTPPQK
jgi:hypothetical protein